MPVLLFSLHRHRLPSRLCTPYIRVGSYQPPILVTEAVVRDSLASLTGLSADVATGSKPSLLSHRFGGQEFSPLPEQLSCMNCYTVCPEPSTKQTFCMEEAGPYQTLALPAASFFCLQSGVVP